VYPPDLTRGYDTPEVNGELTLLDENTNPSFEILRNMEMLIVARVLSRPEPPVNQRLNGCFYVSKAWCKAALKWLDVQEEQRKERYKLKMEAAAAAAAQAEAEEESGHGRGKKKYKHGYGKGKGKKQSKKMKKQERKKNRKLSDACMPPWPNVNHDIICEHGYLKQSCNSGNARSINAGTTSRNLPHSPASGVADNGGSRSARAKRRLMDKQAWKVLKKLYPEGVQLSTREGECIQCTMEAEAKKRNQEMQKLKEKEERKKPLQNEFLRRFYKRARGGVPEDCLTVLPDKDNNGRYSSSTLDSRNSAETPLGKKGSFYKSANKILCPLVPGVYYVLPRAWCHRWRKYIKTGEGGRPCAPDTSACLCDAHRLPLIPPHLESFLYGESTSLLGTSSDIVISESHNDGGIEESSLSLLTSASASTSSPSVAIASVTRQSSSNVVTIHDAATTNRNISPSTSMPLPSSPALPVGFYPVDQRLGYTNGRSRSNQHLSYTRQRQRQESQAHSDLDQQMLSTLRASGLSEAEIQLQRLAMIQIEEQLRQQQQREEENQYHHEVGSDNISNNNIVAMMSPEDIRANLNAKLDRENKVVVEILTEAEFTALEQWWPEIHSSYALNFAVVEKGGEGTEIMWTTAPCRGCDASGYYHDVVVRNRSRNWVKATPQKKKKK